MKKMILKTTIAIFAFFFLGPQLFSQAENQKLINEIDGLNSKLIKANISGDMNAVASMYTDDIIHMPNYAPMVKGKKLMMEKEKEAEDAGFKMLSMTLKIKEVFPAKNLVIEVGEYAVSLTIPNMTAPVADKGKYLTVWERQKDGSLKIKIETWNTDINPMDMGKYKEKEEDVDIDK